MVGIVSYTPIPCGKPEVPGKSSDLFILLILVVYWFISDHSNLIGQNETIMK